MKQMIRHSLPTIALAFILMLGIQSCSQKVVSPQVRTVMGVKQGQTEAEVYELLGKPAFRRFNREQEDWEYRRWESPTTAKVTVITFVNHRVRKLDSYYERIKETPHIKREVKTIKRRVYKPRQREIHRPTRYIQAKPYEEISDYELMEIIDRLGDGRSTSDALRILRIYSKNKRFSCSQVRKIFDQFIFSSDKVKALRVLAPRIVDNENDEILVAEFTEPERSQAMRILGY